MGKLVVALLVLSVAVLVVDETEAWGRFRFRLPRFRLPRFRLPRFRLPRFRLRLPRFRLRLPRFRLRLPRLGRILRFPRIRLRLRLPSLKRVASWVTNPHGSLFNLLANKFLVKQPQVPNCPTMPDGGTIFKKMLCSAEGATPNAGCSAICLAIMGSSDDLKQFADKICPPGCDALCKMDGIGKRELENEDEQDDFAIYDKNSDGKLSDDEISSVLARQTRELVDEKSLNDLLQKADLNGDGYLDREEFLKVTEKEYEDDDDEEFLREMIDENSDLESRGNDDESVDDFSLYDENKDGQITSDEITKILKVNSRELGDESEFDNWFTSGDLNRDGVLDREEFLKVSAKENEDDAELEQSLRELADNDSDMDLLENDSDMDLLEDDSK